MLVSTTHEFVIAGIGSILLFCYLVYALIYPEKF
jgi:K+-transporting ATPase KdpF subunit